MQQNEHCFYKDIELHFYDCDKNKRARLETLMQHTADIGGAAYASKGMTHAWLWEHHYAFLLSRASIKIKRTPIADEKLKIETWERRVKGVLYYRDVVFYDSNDEAVVECSTAWVLADPYTHAILKPSAYTGRVDPYDEKKADCLPAARLSFSEELSTVGVRRVAYSDIDANNHVYNAVYAGIACDFLPEMLMDCEIKEFRINFKHEAILGEDITVKSYIEDKMAIVVGEVNEAISFECEIKFA